jgi:hypothetical protein
MRFAVAGLLISIMACGGGSKDVTAPPPPPPPVVTEHGTIIFSIDPSTCVGTHQTYFEIDSTEVGPESLGPGAVSKAYTVTAESHATQARIAGYFGTAASLWTGNARVTVPANGSVNRHINC